MIWVTRLNGTEMVVNADLIEVVETTPDTVVTLVDGKKYLVHESAREIVERITAYRASILTTVEAPPSATRSDHGQQAAALYVLPSADEER